MEKKKLEKKIEDWAAGLGFCLPDGSSLPPNFFAALTATPNRRQLWEILVESIQPKKKVEYMRKQLLVSQLKERKKNIDNSNTKKINSKLQLWDKQNELETEIEKKKRVCLDIEENIFSKSSDLMFEICKIEKLEKQSNEWKDKAFALNLFSRKAKRMIGEFDNILVPSANENKNTFLQELHHINLQEELQKLCKDVANGNLCNTALSFDHECELQNKLEAIRDSGTAENYLWEEALKQKKVVFEQFLNCLNILTNLEKNIREKEAAIMEDLNKSIVKLKREILEKSLQVMINEAEGRHLDSEIEKLMENIEMFILKSSPDRNLSGSLPYVTQKEIDQSFSFKQKSLAQIKNYVNEVGRKNYLEFLKKEISKIEMKIVKAREECLLQIDSEKKLEETCKSIESVTNQICNLRFQCNDQVKIIMQLNEERLQIMASSPEEIKLEEIMENLKGGLLRQIDLFLEIPLDALKNSESLSKRSSKCPLESCNDPSENPNEIFWPISLYQSNESIIKEVENRKKMKQDIQKFIMEREKLSDLQKKIYSRLSSITYDAKFCEKNSKESDGILSIIECRADKLTTGISFIEQVLKNWLEQPYRHMISDTEKVNGKTLKEFEELCSGKATHIHM